MNSHSNAALDPDPHDTDVDPKHSAEGLSVLTDSGKCHTATSSFELIPYSRR
jgi:hypothetical protein